MTYNLERKSIIRTQEQKDLDMRKLEINIKIVGYQLLKIFLEKKDYISSKKIVDLLKNY